ncbi:FtsH protease activity modulator HflK [Enterobacteriaceae endosymbiont of Plateumaris consimilis]|uniref:FtsH protease activity modulator HflK n=1 Tax=Enterobacteriaceae endosymbiont of Plateumaris consimilis TaxID=2675794 RepID=UPI001449F00C|nr:FtsH protease activity modulator HflK [Enterobacteriaceae endosymbiont of Plateumaris consimilis]QJC28588.1 FtsH protease activity modulator HflK [Enterobacteriaceae endosymbiont of Plateumaris consimilis]
MGQNNFNKNKPIKYFSIFFLLIFLFFFVNGFYIIKNTDKGIIIRLGKLYNLVSPGLHWRIIFLDKINIVNIISVKQLITDGMILTSDLNLVNTKVTVQYKIFDPLAYTMSNQYLMKNFQQSIDSVLNEVIGKFSINYILTKNDNIISNEIKQKLQLIVRKYNFGINILDINLEYFKLPQEVEKSFHDFFLIQENRKHYIRNAMLYCEKKCFQRKKIIFCIKKQDKSYILEIIIKKLSKVKQCNNFLCLYNLFKKIQIQSTNLRIIENIFSNCKQFIIKNNNILLIIDKNYKNNIFKIFFINLI